MGRDPLVKLPAKIGPTQLDDDGVAAKVEMNFDGSTGRVWMEISMFGKSGTAADSADPPPGKEFRRPRGRAVILMISTKSNFIAGGPAESPR